MNITAMGFELTTKTFLGPNTNHYYWDWETGHAELQKAGQGKLDCSTLNGEIISGESECESAAEELGYSFQSTENADDYPKGCYVHDENAVFLNQHPYGDDDEYSSPICKVYT